MYDIPHLYGLQPPQFNCFPSSSSSSSSSESVPFEFGEVLLTLHFCLSRSVNFWKMKKLYIPNHMLYEECYLNQAKQKGGNLPAFHGSRSQQGYGLGSIFKRCFAGRYLIYSKALKCLAKRHYKQESKWLKMFWKEIIC